MVAQITAQEFTDSEGVADWQAEGTEARARFKTGSFAKGAELVARIAQLADAANHHPDVELTYPTVTVHLSTHEVGGLSTRDAKLAQQVSAAARELGIQAEGTPG